MALRCRRVGAVHSIKSGLHVRALPFSLSSRHFGSSVLPLGAPCVDDSLAGPHVSSGGVRPFVVNSSDYCRPRQKSRQYCRRLRVTLFPLPLNFSLLIAASDSIKE